MHAPTSPRSSSLSTHLASVTAATLALLAAACSNDNSQSAGVTQTGMWDFSGPGGGLIATSAHQQGEGRALGLKAVLTGRLVELYATAPSGEPELVARNFLAPASLELANARWTLDYDDFAARERLIVAHPKTSPLFLDVVAELDGAVERVTEHGLAPSELPPYGTVARNAAFALEFDDLLDAQSVDGESVRLALGSQGDRPFTVRVALDAHHGACVDLDGDGEPEFHATRVIVDPAISAAEANAAARPLPVQPLGLPSGAGSSEPNVVLRLATAGDAVLRNASGAALVADIGSLDSASPSRDLARTFSTEPEGSAKSFLSAAVGLTLIGRQAVQITQATHQGGADWQLDLLFGTPACAATIEARDALVYGDGTTLVATSASNPPSGGVITGALFRLVSGSAASVGAAQLQNKWRSTTTAPPACFLTFSPTPLGGPARGVSPAAVVAASFNLPLDPGSLGAFDTFEIVDPNDADPVRQRVVGTLALSVAGTDVVFTPSVPLAHQNGASEPYEVRLHGGPQGILGIGGAEFQLAGLAARFQLDPAAASVQSGGITLRFSSTDEDVPPFATFPTPEVRGQFLYDLQAERLVPRPVTHFSTTLDVDNPIVGTMTQFTTGVQTPLVPLGSKLMQAWRYHDLGFALTDEQTMNVDVEGLAWAPFGGSVVADQFPAFQMALTHSHFLPDEALNQTSLLPKYPASGLSFTYSTNLGDAVSDPLQIVHQKDWGYAISPADTFLASSGTPMHPWPMNHQAPVGEHRHYTWRDTARTYTGAPNGTGAETERFVQVMGIGKAGVPYAKNAVPSVGLPLLMEFRCYPGSSALGLNQFKVALAINSSAAPFFRAYSSGGTLSGGGQKVVDPDNDPIATGGVGASGFPTPPSDNVVYYGQADFVVRVSRAHTLWFDTELGAPQFAAPVIEPSAAAQPAGTQVVLAFRGATALSNPPSATNGASWRNAANLDFYGESKSTALGGNPAAAFTPTFLNADASWKSSLGILDGARYVQARISFVSNEVTGAAPTLSSFAFAYLN